MRPSFPLAVLAALAVAGASHAASMTLRMNHSARVSLAASAASVVVAQPAIADVTVVDSHTLFVTGRSPGVTDVNVIDGFGHTIYSGEIAVTQGGAAVTVYRGVARQDVACSPACTPTTAALQTANAAASSGAASFAPNVSNPMAAVGTAMGGPQAATAPITPR